MKPSLYFISSLGQKPVKCVTSCLSFLRRPCRIIQMSIICSRNLPKGNDWWQEKPNFGSQNLKNVTSRWARIYFEEFNINSSYLAGQYWTYRVGIFTYLICNKESILWVRNGDYYSMFDMLRFLTFFTGDKLKLPLWAFQHISGIL